jgi:phosphoribosylamine--glycine ligase
MLTPDRGPMVIEWNCRFGDPETQVVLARMEDDLYPWLAGVAAGVMPPGTPRWRPGAAVCVVLAAEGYPGKPRLGDRLDLAALTEAAAAAPPGQAGVVAFHAGTGRDADGHLITAGGRVLGVTARGSDLGDARARAYGAIDKVRFPGMHFRRDIGMRGVNERR